MVRIRSFARAMALITLTSVASLIIAGTAPAQDDQAPTWNSNDRHVVFTPHLASDAGPPEPGCFATVEEWLDAMGEWEIQENQRLFREQVQVASGFVEVVNPCPFDIAPPPLAADATIDGETHHVVVNAIPSVVGPGGRMLYLFNVRHDGPSQTFVVNNLYSPQSWEDLAEAARLLTRDREGNDALLPTYDATRLVSLPDVSWEVSQEGDPSVAPFRMWAIASCGNGYTDIGQLNPTSWGLNADSQTTVPGELSFAQCDPTAVTLLGPVIESAFVDAAVGAQPNSMVFDSLTLDQTTDTTFRLLGLVANTNTVAGVPGLFNFQLNRTDGGDPFMFSIPGSEPIIPGIFGLAINNIPGRATDYDEIVASITGTTSAPSALQPAWTLPPTYQFEDDTILSNSWLTPADGPRSYAVRTFYRYRDEDELYFAGTAAVTGGTLFDEVPSELQGADFKERYLEGLYSTTRTIF